jgi:hypothetical protein
MFKKPQSKITPYVNLPIFVLIHLVLVLATLIGFGLEVFLEGFEERLGLVEFFVQRMELGGDFVKGEQQDAAVGYVRPAFC